MKLDVQLTEDDYIKANFLHLRPRPAYKFAGYFVLFLALLVLLISGYRAAAFHEQLFVPTVLILSLFSLWYYFAVAFPKELKRIFGQLKERQEESFIEITDEGVSGKTAFGEETHHWNHLRKWKENKTYFIIYPADIVFIILPKRFFASQNEITELQDLLAKKIGPGLP